MSTNLCHLGKYELQERLGRGGMAEVWKAFDPQLKRYVAIKLLRADLQADPSFVARFEREAQFIAALQHPNIVQIYDFSVSQPPESESTVFYMVMQYVEGPTLAGFIRNTSRTGNFPSPASIVNLFAPIVLAVDYAHQQGMIHRDIKPSNILLDKRNTSHNAMGEPVLSDFGIAKLLTSPSGSLSTLWLGTPHYTSPEQVMGAPGNERSDIYSLGVILYEICTGVLPFQGASPMEIMLQHVNMAPPAPMLINPAISPTLTGVILRALAKEPAARFPTASAMVVALAEAFTMPIPKTLNVLGSLSEGTYSPMHLSPLTPRVPAEGLPFSGAVSATPPSKPQSAASPPPTPLAPAADSGQSSSKGLTDNAPHSTPLPPSSTPRPALAPLQLSASTKVSGPTAPPRTPKPSAPLFSLAAGQRRRWLFSGLIAVLILGVLSSGLLGWLLLKPNPPKSGQLIDQPVVGHAYFISSGQISESSNQGIMDRLVIGIPNVSNPAPGKSYYGWLQPDRLQSNSSQRTIITPVLLGKLPVKNGKIEYTYLGDAHHTNLLATMNIFLITEQEDTAVLPSIPSPDERTWRYGARLFPPSDPFSQESLPSAPGTPPSRNMDLNALRSLLAETPGDMRLPPGGLDIWLFRNTEKVQQWSVAARDDWQTGNFPLVHGHIVRILDYLDGLSSVQRDAPGEPVLVTPINAQVGLLDVDPSTPRSILSQTDVYLKAVIKSPSSTPEQRRLARQIDTAVKDVQARLTNVRKHAQQLVRMSPEQLAQATTRDDLLDPMAKDALSAFGGRSDPMTGSVQEGVRQIHDNIQRLATLDIHQPSGTCPVTYLFYAKCKVGGSSHELRNELVEELMVG